MTRRRLRPWRDVVGVPILLDGRGSVLGPDTRRTARWWEMNLSCGHGAERSARYRPLPPTRRRHDLTRRADETLPPPKRVRCTECPWEV